MSVIFYHDEEQRSLAEASWKAAQSQYDTQSFRSPSKRKIQTIISPAKEFYNAENYHQKYLLQKHPELMELLELKKGPRLIESIEAAKLNGFVAGYGSKDEFDVAAEELGLDQDVVDYVHENFKYSTNHR